MRKVSVFALVVMLSACSNEVVDTEVKPIGEMEAIVNCTYSKPGLCTDCGIGYDGKMSCMMKFKPFCRHYGTQRAIISKAKVIETYENGDANEYLTTSIVKKLSQCE